MSGALGEVTPGRVAAAHLNLGSVEAGTFDGPTPAERANQAAEEVRRTGRGYPAIQATRPQPLGYGLPDSPAGQAAWPPRVRGFFRLYR
ncbi:hypothetical protein [Streptomyces rubrogriseus]|uniref:hypothetical protein n=1 Tax=Streptomyces rubrogriseus TaxID=194673 RepID=UPI001FD411E9|nr:hypothetical protein [Streptomyces rubrogriseus]